MRRFVGATRRATPAPGPAWERISVEDVVSENFFRSGCSFVLPTLPHATWLVLIRMENHWSRTFSDCLPRRRFKTPHTCQCSSGLSSCHQTWTSGALLQGNHELGSHFPVTSMNHGQTGPECVLVRIALRSPIPPRTKGMVAASLVANVWTESTCRMEHKQFHKPSS